MVGSATDVADEAGNSAVTGFVEDGGIIDFATEVVANEEENDPVTGIVADEEITDF